MKNLSASKIVLLWIVLVLGLLAAFAGYHSIVTGEFSDASKVILAAFVSVLNFVCGYYFGTGSPANIPGPDETTNVGVGLK